MANFDGRLIVAASDGIYEVRGDKVVRLNLVHDNG